MFSNALAEKITASCGTRPMRVRRSGRASEASGVPSSSNRPDCGS
jgi:hypothetical protein